jgi:hypothetical protein
MPTPLIPDPRNDKCGVCGKRIVEPDGTDICSNCLLERILGVEESGNNG